MNIYLIEADERDKKSKKNEDPNKPSFLKNLRTIETIWCLTDGLDNVTELLQGLWHHSNGLAGLGILRLPAGALFQ